MLKKIELESYAKINLHLEIVGKLDNGFHEIFSIFQLINLSDRIEIIISDNNMHESREIGDRIEINGNFSCRPENNLIFKTIEEFERIVKTTNKYIINVNKKIPDGGGLGGGSSNSAYVLYHINKSLGQILDNDTLVDIAEGIGSDVPFFLKGNSAVVMGRGEQVYPFQIDLSNYTVLITSPGFKTSTKESYALYDRSSLKYNSPFSGKYDLIAALNKFPSDWEFHNSFTSILRENEKRYDRIFEVLSDYECDYSNITGSGSAVFGIFRNKVYAEAAEKKLKTLYPFVWVGNMLAGCPLLEK